MSNLAEKLFEGLAEAAKQGISNAGPQMGAELIAIGHPVISAADPLAELSRFVREVRAAYRPRAARS